MASLHYLTVQDLIWINARVTKETHLFQFAKLEEATNYQYGYGGSLDALGQGRRFLLGFIKNQPFERGNEPTAVFAALSFLKINGYKVSPGADAKSFLSKVEASGFESIAQKEEGHHGLLADVRSTVLQLMAEHPSLLDLGEAAKVS